jgi:hypothetical protein
MLESCGIKVEKVSCTMSTLGMLEDEVLLRDVENVREVSPGHILNPIDAAKSRPRTLAGIPLEIRSGQ